MARSTNMLPAWASGVFWKGKSEKQVIPCSGSTYQLWLLWQNKTPNCLKVQWASPALGPILLIHSAHLLNTYYMLPGELTNEKY